MNNIWIGAIAGAIAGGVGSFLALKMHGKEKSKKYLPAYMVILFLLLQFTLQSIFNPNSKFLVDIGNKFSSKLPKNILEQVEKLDKSEVSKLTFNGIRRLDANDLYIWNKLRLKMAKNSKQICTGLWTGQVSEDQMTLSLKSLNENETNEWITVSAKALQYELEKKEFSTIKNESMRESLEDLASKFDDDKKIKFVTILNQGINAKADDACFEMLEILNYINNEKSPHRENLARSIAQLGSK